MSRRTVAPIVLVIVAVVLSVLLVPRFGTRINIAYLLLQSVPLLLTAVGQTLVIITAGIDLSVGASVTLADVIASLLMEPAHGGVFVALLVCLAAGVAVGGVNALLIVRFHLPPFLATLGMTFFLAGINLYLRPVPGGFIADGFQRVVSARWGYVPPTVVVTLVVLAAIAVYVDRSRLGLRLRAVGWNERSARLAGVSSEAVKVPAYVGAALLATAAGLFIASRTGNGDPLVGNSYQLGSISAAVLGGADLFGGRGTIWGAVAGAFVLAMIGNVLNLLGVVAYWQWILQGLILLAAVALYAVDLGKLGARKPAGPKWEIGAFQRSQRGG
jgi:ribose/xylose/arabinose/galactoside ABC-type transport system permease subunit